MQGCHPDVQSSMRPSSGGSGNVLNIPEDSLGAGTSSAIREQEQGSSGTCPTAPRPEQASSPAAPPVAPPAARRVHGNLASLLTEEVETSLSSHMDKYEVQMEKLRHSQGVMLTHLNQLIQALKVILHLPELYFDVHSTAALPRIQAHIAAISSKLAAIANRLARVQAHLDNTMTSTPPRS